MSFYYPDYEAHNMLRTPDWRWQRATSLVERGKQFHPKRDDAETGQIVRYLREFHRRQNDGQMEKLADAYPGLHIAHQLHEYGGDQREEVQARLLARQSDEKIASKTDLPPEVVRQYESSFYTVRNSLKARYWIASRVLHTWAVHRNVRAAAASFLKRVAYNLGSHCLEMVLPHLLGDLTWLKDQPNPAESQLVKSMRLVIITEVLPWDQKTNEILFKTHRLLPKSGKTAPFTSTLDEKSAEMIGQTLQRLAAGTLQQAGPPPAAATPTEKKGSSRRTG